MDYGIKESKEALEGMMELSICLVEVFKDGLQFSDIMDLWEKLKNDPLVSAKLAAAYEGYQKVPDELNDLNIDESFELGACALQYMPKLIKSFKK